MLDEVVTWEYRIGLKVSTGKTKHTDPISLTVNQVQLDHFNGFTYLGSQIFTYGSFDADIQQRLQRAQTVFGSLRKPFWNGHEISVGAKVRVYLALVRTIFLCGCKTLLVKRLHENKLKVFKHNCLPSIFRLILNDLISNVDMWRICGIKRCVGITTKERQLKWLGHVLRRPTEYLSH